MVEEQFEMFTRSALLAMAMSLDFVAIKAFPDIVISSEGMDAPISNSYESRPSQQPVARALQAANAKKLDTVIDTDDDHSCPVSRNGNGVPLNRNDTLAQRHVLDQEKTPPHLMDGNNAHQTCSHLAPKLDQPSSLRPREGDWLISLLRGRRRDPHPADCPVTNGPMPTAFEIVKVELWDILVDLRTVCQITVATPDDRVATDLWTSKEWTIRDAIVVLLIPGSITLFVVALAVRQFRKEWDSACGCSHCYECQSCEVCDNSCVVCVRCERNV